VVNEKPLYYIQQVSDGYVIMLGSEVRSLVFKKHEGAMDVLSRFNEGCECCSSVTDDLSFVDRPYCEGFFVKVLCQDCDLQYLQDFLNP
jgi:hypothetical protein